MGAHRPGPYCNNTRLGGLHARAVLTCLAFVSFADVAMSFLYVHASLVIVRVAIVVMSHTFSVRSHLS